VVVLFKTMTALYNQVSLKKPDFLDGIIRLGYAHCDRSPENLV
jgi:hypothetical protein